MIKQDILDGTRGSHGVYHNNNKFYNNIKLSPNLIDHQLSRSLSQNVNYSFVNIQTKPKFNPASDIYEQEADKIAERIMTIPSNMKINSSISKITGLDDKIDGKCKNCDGLHFSVMDEVRRKGNSSLSEEFCSPGSYENEVGKIVGQRGLPLDPSTREYMESRFGYDFSNIRIHNDVDANKSAFKLDALAYSIGNNIVFGQGQYAPSTRSGKHLLAHELTHTLQNANYIQRQSYSKWTLSDKEQTVIGSQNAGKQIPGRSEIRARPSEAASEILALAAKKGLSDTETWFSDFLPIKFLGIKCERPVHKSLAAHLTGVQEKFLSENPGLDAEAVGKKLGLYSMSGAREKDWSMHTFGLAIDINYDTSPYVGENLTEWKITNEIISRATLLVNGKEEWIGKDKDKIGWEGVTYDSLSRLNNALKIYFTYMDDEKELEKKLESASGSWTKMAVPEATQIINNDFGKLISNAVWEREKVDQKDKIKKTGFLDLKKELVTGLDLDWGGKAYGDMMHFDLRNKEIGKKVNDARTEYTSLKTKVSEAKYLSEHS